MDYKERDALRDRKAAEFASLVKELQHHFPDWSLKQSDDTMIYRTYQFERDGLQFSLSLDSSNFEKVTVSTWSWPKYVDWFKLDSNKSPISQGVYPNDLYDPKESSPSIQCSISRGADAIAKDIKRRFLPDYERIYARCLEKATVSQAYHTRSRDNWREICDAAQRLDRTDGYGFSVDTPSLSSIRVERSGDHAKIEFYAGPDTLKKLIEAFGGIKKDNKE